MTPTPDEAARSPWITVWFSPRLTIERLVATRPTYLVWLLAILGMIARGMTNSGIAAELYLSAQTIKSHINRIFAKTGSANRADAIRYAHDHHLG